MFLTKCYVDIYLFIICQYVTISIEISVKDKDLLALHALVNLQILF